MRIKVKTSALSDNPRKTQQLRLNLTAGILRGLAPRAWFVESEAAALLEYVPKHATCIDVGSEFGLYATLFAHAVGKNGRVVAVEANPSLATFLRRVCTAMGADNIEVIHAAATDEDAQTTELSVPYRRGLPVWGRAFSIRGSVGDESNSEFRRSRLVTVPTTTLDQIVAERHIDRVDVIKADIEGAERLMLDGAGGVLAHHRPVWMLEIEDRHLRRYRHTAGDICDLMRKYDYEMLSLSKGRWQACKEVTDTVRNYAFVPAEGCWAVQNLPAAPDPASTAMTTSHSGRTK